MSSLDFVMMNGDDTGIQEEVRLHERYHEELMSLFSGDRPGLGDGERNDPITNFPLLTRVSDYYGEAEFVPMELDVLEVEVGRLEPRASPMLAQVLRELAALIRLAKACGRPVLALPD